jgi:transglutaminase-like putative cysteine protease
MRSWVLFSVLLIATGAAIFFYKLFYLHYPLSAAGEPPTWRVEQVITITGEGGRIVLEVPLPRSSGYQRLLSEEVRSGLLRFAISEDTGDRRARWSGKVQQSTTVSYQVTVTTLSYSHALPSVDKTSEYSERVAAFLGGSTFVQVDDPTVAELSRELALNPSDKVRLAREIFAFVSHEIGGLRGTGAMDAVSVIREGRGDGLGRARLFCALARSNHLPCRIVGGLLLTGSRRGTKHYWNEAYIGGDWVPFDVGKRIAEILPPDRLALSTTDDPDIDSSGTRSVSSRFYVLPQSEPFTEIVRRQIAGSQALVNRFSPLLLPLHAQENLRLLLLVPLGALAMAILRNVVGIRTFGTFMPMLIALAMTTTGLVLGTIILGTIVTLALVSRLWIARFYLLMTPRIAFTLTCVILLMVAIMVVADHLHLKMNGIGMFPFVIMTMIVERITVSLEEEGLRNTVNRVASTLFSIYATYAVIEAHSLQAMFLVYPELLLVILGLLVVVGRYTGYRLTELIRFRELLPPSGPSGDTIPDFQSHTTSGKGRGSPERDGHDAEENKP